MKPSNPQAFPSDYETTYNGMTLRDYFANSAMKEHMSRAYEGNTKHIAFDEYDVIAEYSYKMADAMLKEREK